MDEIALSPIPPPDSTVTVPGSRSMTNRALVCAALAEGRSVLTGWLDAEDTQVMRDGLQRLGAGIEEREEGLVVHGSGGRFAIPMRPLDCELSGTTIRFLTACAALSPGRVVLDGTPRMRERPIKDLADALGQLGVHGEDRGRLPARDGPGGRASGRVGQDRRQPLLAVRLGAADGRTVRIGGRRDQG